MLNMGIPIKNPGTVAIAIAICAGIITLTAFSCRAALGAEHSSPDNSEWILVQQHWTLGKTKLYVTAQAVRIDSQDGLTVVAQAPEWRPICFRAAEKIVWSCPLREFRGVTAFQDTDSAETMGDYCKLQKHYEYVGLDCQKYGTLSRPTAYTLTTDQIPADKNAANLLCRYYHIPRVMQIPMMRQERRSLNERELARSKDAKESYLAVKDLHEGTLIYLNTISASRKKIDKADFHIPKSLQAVNNASDLVLSNEQQGQLTDIMSQFGFSSEVARH